MMDEIVSICQNNNYKGVVLKCIAQKAEVGFVNYYTSFTFSDDIYATIGEPEWHEYSKTQIIVPILNYDDVKKIIEFTCLRDDLLLMRKHFSVEEFYKLLKKVETTKRLDIEGNIISYDIDFDHKEEYVIGSHFNSIFSSGNCNLARSSTVFALWSNETNYMPLKPVETAIINGIEVSSPIISLIGFLGADKFNELKGSIGIYFPNFDAWFLSDKKEKGTTPSEHNGTRVEVGIATKNKSDINKLSIIYKLTRSDETLLWNIYKLDNVKYPTGSENEVIMFYQPLPDDVDKTFFMLISNDMKICDFTTEQPYVEELHYTMDINGGGRKVRKTFSVGDKLDKNSILRKKKADLLRLTKKKVLYEAGNQLTAIMEIQSIVDKANTKVSIIDPYFGNCSDDWNILSNIASSTKVMILTFYVNNDFANDLVIARSSNLQIEVAKIFYQHPLSHKQYNPIHDRFIIVDDSNVWQVGTSINGLGKRATTIININSPESEDIIKLFNYYWTNPAPTHQVLINGVWSTIPVTKQIMS